MPSMPVPFVGPSYQLANRRADVQRTVNMYPVRVESGTGKSGVYLKSVPGLTSLVTSTTANKNVFRGVTSHSDTKTFCVLGNGFYELDGTTLTLEGTTTTITNQTIVMAAGREHVVVVDKSFGYSYEVATGTFTQITDVDFPSLPNWVTYLAGRYIFGARFNDQFYWSAIDDPLTYDALDFATAESSPDGLVRGIVYREELWLFGSRTTEVWRASASADAAFERNTGVSISVGCAAPYSVSLLDNSLLWVGRDENGSNVVYMASGYQPRRISNHAIEEKLGTVALPQDIEEAQAYCYQQNGHAFYCLNVPGLDTTLCYDISTDSWHERADFFDGDFSQSRITHHVMSPLGEHYFCGSLSGHPTLSDRAVIYTGSESVYTLDGDTLCRERTSPHYATPALNTVFFPRFRLDCSVGSAVASPKYVQLSYSNDGGSTWSASALQRSLGETGDRRVMVQWNRLGSARDRVWRLRCTDDVAFDIINADVQALEGVA